MNKKAFSLVELLGVITLIAIIGGLAVISMTHIINSSKKGLYQNYERTLEGAAKNALSDYVVASSSKIQSSSFLSDVDSKWKSNNINLSYQSLLNSKYLDKFDDPNGGDCSFSYVNVIKNGTNGINIDFKYNTCVICKDDNGNVIYKTEPRDESYSC